MWSTYVRHRQGRVSTPVTAIESYELIRQIDTRPLLNDMHTVSFRFRDVLDQWSVTVKDTFTISGVVLPIELTNFTATCQNNDVLMTWETASEKNNAYFEILKSTSPQSGWELETKIVGKGNSQTVTQYNYTVKSPSKISYYRLKQVDASGEVHYSKTISVVCQDNPHHLKVYPNPAIDLLYIETDVNDNKIQVEIYDLLGKLIQQKEFEGGLYPVEMRLLDDIKTGVYVVKVVTNKNVVVGMKRLVVGK